MAARFDIVLTQGESYSQEFPITGVDLTDYSTGIAQVRVAYDTVLVAATLSVTVVSLGAGTGTVKVSLAMATVNNLSAGLYVWDLFLQALVNPPIKLLEGETVVIPRVTRA